MEVSATPPVVGCADAMSGKVERMAKARPFEVSIVYDVFGRKYC